MQNFARNKLIYALWAAVVISALAVVTARHQNRQAFVAWQQAETARVELQTERGRLLLEKATWAGRRNVVSDARARLAMQAPAPAAIVVMRLGRGGG